MSVSEAVKRKRALRRALLAARAASSVEDRRRADRDRTALVIEHLRAMQPDALAAYVSVGTEPSTLELIDWFADRGAVVWLPVLTGHFDRTGGTPAWGRYAGRNRLRVGPYGIKEPEGEVAVNLPPVPAVIVPAVAATRAGDRLGRGGGWYDRVLNTLPDSTLTVTLLAPSEILPELPVEQHDHPVSVIATDVEWLVCRRPTG